MGGGLTIDGGGQGQHHFANAFKPRAANQRLDAQTREDVLRQAMEALPEEQRSLVRLAFFDSLSHSDIATRTGLPLGTVKSRIRLAFSRLRRELEAGGVEDAV